MSFPKRRRFISVIGRKSAVPEGLWMKCNGCGQPVLSEEVEQNMWVCPRCCYHYRIPARQRIEYLADKGSFEETHGQLVSTDPLGFSIKEVDYSYSAKLKSYQKKTGLNEAIVSGIAAIEQQHLVLAVMDFSFAGASMGSVVGERFCRAAEDAVKQRLPYVVFTASGGARMQEGILSLMQMAKTAGAVSALNDARVPYITVLTNPTTGGVSASFASLGDIILAEPGAEIGFAGKRLIQGALKVDIPPGFQSAEYQYENGFVDRIVERADIRPLLGKLLRYLPPA